MVLELVRATVAISFVVVTAWNLAVMADTIVDVENVTVEVGGTSKGLGTAAIDARHFFGWYSGSCDTHHIVGQVVFLRSI